MPVTLSVMSSCQFIEETWSETNDATNAAWTKTLNGSQDNISRHIGGYWHRHSGCKSYVDRKGEVCHSECFVEFGNRFDEVIVIVK